MAVLMSKKIRLLLLWFLAPFGPHGARILESREDDISVSAWVSGRGGEGWEKKRKPALHVSICVGKPPNKNIILGYWVIILMNTADDLTALARVTVQSVLSGMQ